MRTKYLISGFALSLLITTGCWRNSAVSLQEAKGPIRGNVISTDEFGRYESSFENVEVRAGYYEPVTTDMNGRFYTTDVAAGNIGISFGKIGYGSFSITNFSHLGTGQPSELNFTPVLSKYSTVVPTALSVINQPNFASLVSCTIPAFTDPTAAEQEVLFLYRETLL